MLKMGAFLKQILLVLIYFSFYDLTYPLFFNSKIASQLSKRIDWIAHCKHDPYPIFDALGHPGIISIFSSHKSKQKTNLRIL